jgi:hypothetical protein
MFEAFLFLNMVTLTILYSILFFFLRAQTKGLLISSSTTDQQTGADDSTTSAPWEVTLGALDDDPETSPARPSGPVIVTKSVTIYTEGSSNPRPFANAQRTHNRINKVSVTLLIYPIVYMLLTLPLSTARIAQFADQEWPLAVLHFGAGMFECTGWINVLLYTSTRKGLVSWNRLKFWKNGANKVAPSSGWRRKWNSRAALEDDMDEFDSIQTACRITSKTSASSIVVLNEGFSRGAGQKQGESDKDSHLGF